jgi:hypothetical protein
MLRILFRLTFVYFSAICAESQMINAALSHLAGQLNQQFKNNFQLIEDIAVVSNLFETMEQQQLKPIINWY